MANLFSLRFLIVSALLFIYTEQLQTYNADEQYIRAGQIVNAISIKRSVVKKTQCVQSKLSSYFGQAPAVTENSLETPQHGVKRHGEDMENDANLSNTTATSGEAENKKRKVGEIAWCLHVKTSYSVEMNFESYPIRLAEHISSDSGSEEDDEDEGETDGSEEGDDADTSADKEKEEEEFLNFEFVGETAEEDETQESKLEKTKHMLLERYRMYGPQGMKKPYLQLKEIPVVKDSNGDFFDSTTLHGKNNRGGAEKLNCIVPEFHYDGFMARRHSYDLNYGRNSVHQRSSTDTFISLDQMNKKLKGGDFADFSFEFPSTYRKLTEESQRDRENEGQFFQTHFSQYFKTDVLDLLELIYVSQQPPRFFTAEEGTADPVFSSERFIHIDSLYSDDLRGTGLTGSMILNEIEKFGKKEGVKGVTLDDESRLEINNYNLKHGKSTLSLNATFVYSVLNKRNLEFLSETSFYSSRGYAPQNRDDETQNRDHETREGGLIESAEEERKWCRALLDDRRLSPQYLLSYWKNETQDEKTPQGVPFDEIHNVFSSEILPQFSSYSEGGFFLSFLHTFKDTLRAAVDIWRVAEANVTKEFRTISSENLEELEYAIKESGSVEDLIFVQKNYQAPYGKILHAMALAEAATKFLQFLSDYFWDDNFRGTRLKLLTTSE